MDDVGLVPLSSKLVWLLSKLVTKHNSSCLTTHTENSAMQISNYIIDENNMEKFWNLDLKKFKKRNVQYKESI